MSSSLIPVLPVPLLDPSTTSSPPPPMATTTATDAVAKMVSGAHAAADKAAAALAFRPSISYPSLDVYADGTIKQHWSGKTLERTKRAGRWYVFTRDLTEEGDATAAAATVGGAPPPPATKLVDRIICEAWNGPHSTLLHSHMGHVTYLDDNRENLTPANLVWCTIEAHAAMQQRGKKKRECKAAAAAAAAAARVGAAGAEASAAASATTPTRFMHLPPPQQHLSFDGTMAGAIQSFYDDWSVPGSQQQQQTDDENDDDTGEPAAKRRKASDTDDDGEDVPILVHPTAAAVTAPPTPAFRPQQMHAPRRSPVAVFRYANPDMSDAVFQMDAQRPKMIVGAFHSLNDAVQAMSARLKRDYVEVGNALLLVLNQPLCQLGGFSWVTPSRLVELHCPPRLATAAAPPTPAFRPAAHPTSAAAAASSTAQ